MIKKIAGLLTCIVLSLSAWSQFDPDSVFKKQILIEDLYSLKKTIVDSHPNPYAFISKEDFHKGFTQAIESIDSVMTLGEYTMIVANVLNMLKDSHTGIEYGHLQKMQTEHGKGFVPVRLHSVNGGVYVALDRDSILPNGSQILCWDNIDASKLYVESTKYANIEGSAVTGQRRVADAIFPFIVGLKHPMPDTVAIDFQRFGSDSIETAYYPLMKKARWDQRQKMLNKTEFERQQSLSFYRHDTLAVLKVGTFAPGDGNRYKKFITKAFEEINKRNVQVLVLDIRDNSGGQSSNVEFLYSFLKKEGHNTPSNIIAKSSKLAKDRSKHLQKGFTRFMLRTFFKHDEDIQGFLRWSNLPEGVMDTIYFNQKLKQNADLVYEGKCVLLINGLTASAGVDFTHTFLAEKRGEIIGEPCLGPMSGTFGNPAAYKLPHTKLGVTIATIRYNYDNTFEYDPLPIKPTIQVDVLPEHLANNKDACIQYVLSHLEELK